MPQEKKNESQGLSFLTLYLIFYNFLQTIGWSALLYVMVMHCAVERTHFGMYKTGGPLLNIFQTLAILEVVHVILGMVRSNLFVTGFQLLSRIAVTWAITYSVPDVQNEIGVTMFMLAWAITEVVRYSYYTCNLLGSVPYPITWCRYTLFIMLYPIGVTGEMMTLWKALPYVEKTGLYSVSMPNALNMSFSFYGIICLGLFLYFPIFPQLYMHMFAQRGKIIGGSKSKKE